MVFFRCTKLCHYVDNNGKDFQVCGLPSPSTCGNSYPPSSTTPLLQSLNNIPEGTLLVTLVISHHLHTNIPHQEGNESCIEALNTRAIQHPPSTRKSMVVTHWRHIFPLESWKGKSEPLHMRNQPSTPHNQVHSRMVQGKCILFGHNREARRWKSSDRLVCKTNK